MITDFLTKNANYDTINGMPSEIVHDVDSTSLFRCNINEVVEDGEVTGYTCIEVRVPSPITASKVNKALRDCLCSKDDMLRYLHDFNSAALKIKSADAATRYRQLLEAYNEINKITSLI